MEENSIVLNGKKIDLTKLSDEELVALHKEVKTKQKKYQSLIEKYIEKYPFLKDVK